MCDGDGPAATTAPRPAPGPPVDPIALEPVDEVVITTLVDNVFDALLAGGDRVTRVPLATGRVAAPQFGDGITVPGLRAEHGFSALVTVRRGTTSTTLLFDTGISPDGMLDYADRLGVGLGRVLGRRPQPRALRPRRRSRRERRQPSLLVDGEVDRTTDFERGMPPSHQAWDDAGWRHDPPVVDDQHRPGHGH